MITHDRSILYVVACSATKTAALKAGPTAARNAYAGQAFTMLRDRLESAGQRWCILSGFYGFVWPTTIIEHYEQKMEPVTEDTQWDDCFGHITNRQYATLMTAERVVVLGSALYATAASVLLKRPVSAPLAGLTIGRMLQRISAINPTMEAA